jgi:uncharacterized protein YciI
MPHYLIIADDYTDGEALNRRLAVREKHLERMKAEKEKGVFVFAGAKFNDEDKMIGSVLVVSLASESAVKEWVNNDPYIENKVWDKITITPFKIAPV